MMKGQGIGVIWWDYSTSHIIMQRNDMEPRLLSCKVMIKEDNWAER